jgi:hypothetical protein
VARPVCFGLKFQNHVPHLPNPTPTMPKAAQQHLVPFTDLAQLPRRSFEVDPTQPFPMYGWLKLHWRSADAVVATQGGVSHQ